MGLRDPQSTAATATGCGGARHTARAHSVDVRQIKNLGQSEQRDFLARLLLHEIQQSRRHSCMKGESVMAWILIRTFVIAPIVLLVATPVLVVYGLYVALDSRDRLASHEAMTS